MGCEGKLADMLEETKDELWNQKITHYLSLLPKSPGFPADFVPPPCDPKLLGKPHLAPPCSSELPQFVFPDLIDFGGENASVIAGSSTTYSMPGNMLRPGRGINMGDGWETARIRNSVPEEVFQLDSPLFKEYNWVVIKLQQVSNGFSKIVVDTFHFVNNSPLAFAIDGTNCSDMDLENYYTWNVDWFSIMPPTQLVPHKEQLFEINPAGQPITHVLVKIFPCGGLSRLRLYGTNP